MPCRKGVLIVKAYWRNRAQRENFAFICHKKRVDFNVLTEVKDPEINPKTGRRIREAPGGDCPTVDVELWGPEDGMAEIANSEALVKEWRQALDVKVPGYARPDAHLTPRHTKPSERELDKRAAVKRLQPQRDVDPGQWAEINRVIETANTIFHNPILAPSGVTL
jgi:hypothetical protein